MEIRILGPVDIAGAPAGAHLRRRQERYLLAVLAIEHRRFVTLDRLVDLIWDDNPPGAARRTAHSMVSRVRSALDGGACSVRGRHGAYALDGPDEEVDLWLFRRLVDRAGAAASADSKVELLESALALWRGPALADTGGGRAADSLRAGLEEQRLAALEELWEQLLHRREAGRVVAESAPALAANPHRESLVRIRMRARHQCGQATAATTEYAELTRRLRDDLGVSPAAETSDLHAAILRDDPALHDAPVPAADVPAQLPAPASHFRGRAAELAELDALARAESTVSVITGPAGVGKTALAVAWAQRTREMYPDGQIYLDLRGVANRDPMTPVHAVSLSLQALGVAVEAVPPEIDAAAAMFRTLVADRKLLLVLDNALDADQVRPLLPGGATCRTVITSRQTMAGLVALSGAGLVRLGALSRPDSIDLVYALVADDRLADPDDAGRLVDACAALPLALRIAAANLLVDPEVGIGDYLGRLARARLDALAVADDPHVAVRAAFDLSYRRLSVAAQRMFTLLGAAMVETVDRRAADVLHGSPHAGPLLAELVDAHLVEERAPGRFGLHDLLRDYSTELGAARPGSATEARDRLYSWYLSVSHRIAALRYPHMARLAAPPDPQPGVPPLDAASGLRWFETELPNLGAAVHAAATAGPPEYAWRLADALRGYFWSDRNGTGWYEMGQHALAAATAERDDDGRAAAEIVLGNHAWSLARPLVAIEHFGRAVDHARAAGWIRGESSALGNIGALYNEIGQLRRAAEFHEAALAIDRASGWADGISMRLNNLGVVYEHLGLIDRAATQYTQAMELYRAGGWPGGVAVSLGHLSVANNFLGDLDLAERQAAEAVRINEDRGDRFAARFAELNLAEVNVAAGRIDAARTTVEDLIEFAGEVGDRRLLAIAETLLGTVEVIEQRYDPAFERLSRAIAILDQTGEKYCRVQALCQLVVAAAALGRIDEATTAADEAEAVVERSELLLLRGDVTWARAHVYAAAGDRDRADRLAAEAAAAFARIGRRLDAARAFTPPDTGRDPGGLAAES